MPQVVRRLRAERAGLRALPGGVDALDADALLRKAGRGDREAYTKLYDLVAGQVYGLVRRVLRDPAQSEEVAQEVLLEVWRLAPRFDTERGSARAWIMTMAHRRAVDRVRSEQAGRDREDRAGRASIEIERDEVAEEVETRMEHERVRMALSQLTHLQREAVELAYYGGHTYAQVAELLDAPLGTVKTRLRDGLIRLRDELGVGE